MYKALYRKYRPRTFDDLVGQEHISQVLKNQIDTQSISHAYLFSGTRGTGKTSCAKIFARGINCLSDGDKPCNICENCLESLDDSAIDIVEIDAASNNGVDNIRDLKDRAFYQPTSLKYKVYIIDEVHMLSKGAFNALLKILEEPPSHLVFILATTEPERIPLTILSRCQKFQFKRLDFKTIERSLKEIGQKEKINIDDRTYELLANSADGSMRDAQSILEQLVSSGHKDINYDLAINILGLVNINTVTDIVTSLIENNPQKLLESLDNGLGLGKDTEQLGKDILSYFRNLMIAKVTGKSTERFINSNVDLYKDQSCKLTIDKILGVMEKLINQLNEIKYSQQKRILLEINLVEILEFLHENQKESKNEVNNTSEKNIEIKFEKDLKLKDEGKNENKESFEVVMEKEDKEQEQEEEKIDISSPKLTIDIIRGDWNNILKEIRNSPQKLLQAIVIEASIVDFKEDTLTLGFLKDYTFHKNKLMEVENREFLEKVISMFYNIKVKINAIFIDSEDKDSIDEDINVLTNLVGKDNIQIF